MKAKGGFNMGIGKNIEKYRKRKNLMQKELATLLGVTPQAVSNYESDISSPKEPILFKILDVLEITPNELFTGIDETKKSPAPEGTGEKEFILLDETNDLLVELGYIQKGQQLSDADLAFLEHWIGLLDAWFRGK